MKRKTEEGTFRNKIAEEEFLVFLVASLKKELIVSKKLIEQSVLGLLVLLKLF